MQQWTFFATQSERGWDVGGHDNKGNSMPQTSYPNAAKAGARLLQLMEVGAPVTPQDWPELIGLG